MLLGCPRFEEIIPVKQPYINFVNPKFAKTGETITIIGIGFGASGVVSFTGANANYVPSWSDTVINVKVPIGATIGKVSVTANGKKSNEVDFFVLPLSSTDCYDIEGNKYKTVKIGSQVWMAENLKSSRYNNGDTIPRAITSEEWSGRTDGACCFYNNMSVYYAVYGNLYNWYAVNDPRGLAPKGWHIPTDAEWQQLGDYLGGDSIAGGKMKSTGIYFWKTPNTGATNESGFSGLPGGDRFSSGYFFNLGYNGYWWSASENSTIEASFWVLGYNTSERINLGVEKGYGFSVRCVKD